MRAPTFQTSRQAFDAISLRQAQQARLQEQVASGLRVQSPADDPAAAAQAELARSRLARIAQDRRSTDLATSVLDTADGAISHGIDLLQSARESLVAAGDGAFGPTERKALALQLRSTREEMLALANTGDGSGGFVFGGQGSSSDPFTAGPSPAFAAAAGDQRVGEAGRYPTTVDGRSLFMQVPQGNGVFVTGSSPGNTGGGWIGVGGVSDSARLTGHAYAITLGGTAAAPTYTVTDTTAGTTLAANVAFTAGAAIDIDGQRVSVGGQPAPGDSFTLAPAGRQSVFATLDDAIALLEGTRAPAAYNEGLERVQAGLDRVLDGLGLARAGVGDALRAVQGAADTGERDAVDTTARRSALRDVDLAKAVSDLQASSTASEAAIKSYATLARTSLLDYLR